MDNNNNIELCPVCKNQGESVNKITVEHLVADDHHNEVIGEHYQLCMNKDCEVVYYNNANDVKFLKDQIKVPIWFKKNAEPKYACYCSKVTEKQVIEAVIYHGTKTVKEVNEITGAMKNPDCKKNNPLGVCCHKIVQEGIDKGIAVIADV